MLNRQSLNRFAHQLRVNYELTGRDPANERYTHGHLIVFLEGLAELGRRAKEGLYRQLEKPLDPLTPERTEQLRKLEDRVDGLEMHQDSKSLREESAPEILYAMYNGNHLGSCYGSRFEEGHAAHSKPDHTRVTSMIHEVYQAKTAAPKQGPFRTVPEDKDN